MKSTSPWMFSSYKTSKGKNKDFARKNKFFADADTDGNADADAEMSMPRFPNGLYTNCFEVIATFNHFN